MERRELLVVDAFADEPVGGLAVPVLPDGSSLTDTQLDAAAAEVGAPGLVTYRDDEIQHVPRVGNGAPVATAVAGAVGLREAGGLEPGEHTVVHTDGGTSSVELREDRTVTVETSQSVAVSDIGPTAAAETLGLPAAAVTDVELPVGEADGAGGSVFVPVTFLDRLGRASPEPGALTELLGDRTRLVAFTFDTLAAESNVHVRVFEPNGERAASGVGTAGCARYLATQEAFDSEHERVRVESGRFLDRPATLDADLSSGTVTGRALLGVAGTVNLPPDEGNNIVEL